MSGKLPLFSLSYEVLIALLLSSLVFSFKTNTILTAVFVFTCIWENYRYTKKELLKEGLLLLCSLFFVGLLISALVSTNTIQGLKFLERNISFLAIPLAMSLLKKGNKYFNLGKMLLYYLRFLTVLIVLSIIIAFYKNHMFNIEQGQAFYKMKSWFFTYHYLSQNINCSAIYLSLYLGFCIQLLVFDITGFYQFIKQKFMIKVVWLGFLIFVLLLLSARTIIFFTLMSSVILMGFWAYRSSRLWVFTVGVGIVVIMGGAFIQNNDVLRLRLESAFTSKEDAKFFSGGLSSRLQQWELLSEEVWESAPYFGVGVGDADQVYQALYKENALDWAAENRFNAHSMYMEAFFLMGAMGLLLLFALILFPSIKAIRDRNFLYLMFLALFSFAGLTESLLNRQYGIVFFTTLISAFYYWPNKNPLK